MTKENAHFINKCYTIVFIREERNITFMARTASSIKCSKAKINEYYGYPAAFLL